MTNNGTKVLEAFSPKERGFVFAPESDILPTAFINEDGFIEVLRLRSG